MAELHQLRAAQTIFFELIDLPQAARTSRIRALAGEDPSLAQMVQRLLALDNQTFTLSPAVTSDPLPRPGEVRLSVGQRVGPYRLDAVLGQGGMGAVYEATHAQTGRRAALKTVRYASPRVLASMRHEIASLSRLSHPAVVQLLEHGTHAGVPWAALALVEGTTLGAWIQQPSLVETPCVLRALMEVAQALAWLHGEGVVHRDLKPGNILLDADDAPILVDFGIAEQAGQQREQLSISLAGSGTLEYMAPEQRQGAVVDARADLYALGRLIDELVLPRQDLEPPLRAAVAALCARLQAAEPTNRPGYASDIARDLAALGAAAAPGRTLPSPQPYLYRPALTGRSEALSLLTDALADPSLGMVLLTGPPGVGRTRLLSEVALLALRRRRRMIWGRGLGPSLGALHLWRELVASTSDLCRESGSLDLLGAHPEHLAARFSVLGDELAAKRSTTEQQRQALLSLLRALISDAPLVLLLDDLHLADPMSLSVLRSLVAAPPPGLLVVASARSEEAPALLELGTLPGACHRALAPLSHDEISALMASALALPTPPSWLRAFPQLAEGSPYAAMQLLREAIEQGAVTRTPEAGWQLRAPGAAARLPQGLAALEASRVERLGGTERTVAIAAATLGPEIQPALLEIVVGAPLDVLSASLRALERRGFVERDPWSGRVRFARREVWVQVRDSRTPEEAVRLHGRAAVALEIAEPGQLLAISRHLEAAGDRRKAADAAARAAHRAEATQDYSGCVEAVERFVRTAPDCADARGVAVRTQYVRSFWVAGRAARGAEIVHAAREDARQLADPKVLLLATIALGSALRYTGAHDDALGVLEEVLELAEAQQRPQIQISALLNMDKIFAKLGRSDEAIAALWRAHRLTGGDPERQTEVLTAIGTRLYLNVDSDEAIPVLREALDRSTDQGMRSNTGLWLARALIRSGRHEEGQAACHAALQDARESGRHHTEIQLLGTLARAVESEQAISLVWEAVRRAEALQLTLPTITLKNDAASRLFLAGRLEESQALLEQAVRQLDQTGPSLNRDVIRTNLRLLAAQLHDARAEWAACEAEAAAGLASQGPRSAGLTNPFQLLLSRSLRSQGKDLARSVALAQEVAERTRRPQDRKIHTGALIELSWHRLARGEAIDDLLEQIEATMAAGEGPGGWQLHRRALAALRAAAAG